MLRVLIVDDDPISLRFLQAALNQSGCDAAGADSCSAALAAVAASAFDLLLLDCNLPDGSGSDLLAELRLRGSACPAVATSAEMTAEMQTRLGASGFAACIQKPVTLPRLQEILQPWLEKTDLALLDDEPALAALGSDRSALQMLRGMLAQELSALQADMSAGLVATAPLLERLHRLRASCGFCGTPKLAAAATAFQRAIRADPTDTGAQCEQFLACCAETIAVIAN